VHELEPLAGLREGDLLERDEALAPLALDRRQRPLPLAPTMRPRAVASAVPEGESFLPSGASRADAGAGQPRARLLGEAHLEHRPDREVGHDEPAHKPPWRQA
jgi:hypothetical protein